MKCRHRGLRAAQVALLFAGCVLPFTARAQEEKSINLGIGTQRVITVHGVSKIAVGDKSVADVRSTGKDQILVTGVGEGRTSLLVWRQSGQRQSYTVNVRRTD